MLVQFDCTKVVYTLSIEVWSNLSYICLVGFLQLYSYQTTSCAASSASLWHTKAAPS